jgi:hypothetical protein
MDVEKVIEAGARALADDNAWDYDGLRDAGRLMLLRQARACLTAAQAEWQVHGAVLAMVPQKRAMPGAMGTEAALDYAQGFNAAIAAMRAGEVGL